MKQRAVLITLTAVLAAAAWVHPLLTFAVMLVMPIMGAALAGAGVGKINLLAAVAFFAAAYARMRAILWAPAFCVAIILCLESVGHA